MTVGQVQGNLAQPSGFLQN
nr:C6 peptide [Vigna sinensis=cowpeas, CH-19, seeds, Peptide Partial, 19 aa] [Vigna unguiculata subsp. unguiculata]